MNLTGLLRPFLFTEMELLSPAGNIEAAKAALSAGADAIYIGTAFSARAYAGNFDEKELEEIIKTAHLLGRRVYVAVNIMILEEEFKDALEHLKRLYLLGADAVIISDMGLFYAAQKCVPELEMHISTQAGIHSKKGALLVKSLGAKRVVPARECTMEMLKSIADCEIEVEAFCHGALCSGYSGACLMSSFIGGRSGNRGKCAQPCRMLYTLYGKTAYTLSTADLCTIDILPRFFEAKTASLKIEGRMKRPEYVYAVTKAYRNALDEGFDKKDEVLLKQIFNRGGFTHGYLLGKRDVTYEKRPEHLGVLIGKVKRVYENRRALIDTKARLNKLDNLSFGNAGRLIIGFCDKADGGYIVPVPKGVKKNDSVFRIDDAALLDDIRKKMNVLPSVPVSCELFLSTSREGYIIYKTDNEQYEVKIAACETANKPLTKEYCENSLKKSGDTCFNVKEVNVRLSENPFISVSALNEKRRRCLSGLQDEILNRYKRSKEKIYELPEISAVNRESKVKLIAGVRTFEQAEAAALSGADEIYVYPSKFTRHEEFLKLKDIKKYICLTPFLTSADAEKLSEISYIYDGAVCSGLDEICTAKEFFTDVRGDYLLNVANSYAQKMLFESGVKSVTASLELSEKTLKKLKYPFEAVAYGHIPVMTTRHCPIKKSGRCPECGEASLKDRKNYEFKTVNFGLSDCMFTLLNSVLTAIEPSMLIDAGAQAVRLMFFYESESEVAAVTKKYAMAIEEGKNVNTEEEHNTLHLFRRI